MTRAACVLLALPLLWLAYARVRRGRDLLQAPVARDSSSSSKHSTRRRDRLQIEWGQLQLEQSAWSTHAFVERVANRA